MAKSYDDKSISIMFFSFPKPTVTKTNIIVTQTTATLETKPFCRLDELLKQLEKLNILGPNYSIVGHCQIDNSTLSPGSMLMTEIRLYSQLNQFNESNILTHWIDENELSCYRTQEQIESTALTELLKKLDRNPVNN